jgi:uncharacterized protein YutE (UPF0331/DUF86 family)
MVKPEVIRRRLEKLDEYLTYLKEVQKKEQEQFLNQTEIWASAERFLQMAIESINDIANHIIAEENYGTMEKYSDLPNLFFEKSLIDDELKQKWIQMIGFRNILVHGYTEIDRNEVYKIINQNLDDIKRIKQVLAQFL